MTDHPLLNSRYRYVRLLGPGSAAEVWECVDETYDRPVAVTLLRLREVPHPAIEPFQHDARMVGLLDHPGIVRVHDIGVDESTAYLVTELMPGPTLRAVIDSTGSMPVDEAVHIADQLLEALGAAHAAGVIHKRVQPSNVKVGGDGTVRLLDFGVAALYEGGALTTSADTDAAESAGYMAPEQAVGEGVDARTDLYAMGCLLTAMLTGRPPFTGESAVAIADQHVNTQAAPLVDLRPDVPHVLDVFVGRLLAKDPADRPASSEEARLELRSGESFSTGVTPGQAEQSAVDSAHSPPARQWSFLLPAYVVVALVLVVGALAFVATRGGIMP